MAHRIGGRKLSRKQGPRLALFKNLTVSVLRYERVKTTEAKAKEIRPIAERMITLGKDGTVHARRQALAYVNDKDVVSKLFADIAPRFASRPGGYTRIIKLGPRLGDGAAMAQVELVERAAETA